MVIDRGPPKSSQSKEWGHCHISLAKCAYYAAISSLRVVVWEHTQECEWISAEIVVWADLCHERQVGCKMYLYKLQNVFLQITKSQWISAADVVVWASQPRALVVCSARDGVCPSATWADKSWAVFQQFCFDIIGQISWSTNFTKLFETQFWYCFKQYILVFINQYNLDGQKQSDKGVVLFGI